MTGQRDEHVGGLTDKDENTIMSVREVEDKHRGRNIYTTKVRRTE